MEPDIILSNVSGDESITTPSRPDHVFRESFSPTPHMWKRLSRWLKNPDTYIDVMIDINALRISNKCVGMTQILECKEFAKALDYTEWRNF